MSERLTLQDLVDLLAEKQGITKKDSEAFIRELVDLTSETVAAKDFVRIKDFGTFKLTAVKARKSVDVNTGEDIEIKAHYKLSFTPDKVLREGVNKPFAHFESILLEEDVSLEGKKAKSKTKEVAASVEIAEEIIEKEQPIISEEITIEDKKVEEALIEELVEENSSEENNDAVEEIEDEKNESATESLDAPLGLVQEENVVEVLEEEAIALEEKVTDEVTEEKQEQSSVILSPSDEKIEEDDNFVDYEALSREKKKKKTKIAIAIFLLLLLAIGYWGYSKYFSGSEDNTPTSQNNSSITISDDGTENSQDNSETVQEGEVESEGGSITEDEVPLVKQEDPVIAANSEETTIKVGPGDTLRKMGKKYFGYDAFWVYIYEENRSRITNPNALLQGLELVLPSRSKYGIDPDSEESRKKAEALEQKLFDEFRNL